MTIAGSPNQLQGISSVDGGCLPGDAVRIVAGGDLSPGDHYFNLGHGVRNHIERFGLEALLEDISPLFRSADIGFCNLEGPTSDVGLRPSEYRSLAFRGAPGVPAALRSAGITMVSVANNHMLQHGVDAFDDTVARLLTAGIDPVGIRGSGGWTCKPVFRAVGSTTVGVLGYSLVPEQFCPSGCPPYAAATPEKILRDVRRIREVSDIVVVSCHFGVEGAAEPGKFERKFLQDLVSSGVAVVLGHHPHVFQPVELGDGNVIAPSLGHLLFDLFWDVRLCASALLDLQVDRTGITAVRLHPIMIEKGCRVRRSGVDRFPAGIAWSMIIRQPSDTQTKSNVPASNGRRSYQTGLRKLMYFSCNLWRGNRKAKFMFLEDKVRGRL